MTIDSDCIRDPALRPIAQAVSSGQRLDERALKAMLATHDINGLTTISSAVRQARHGLNTYYGNSLNLNYTNICELRCPLCAFSRDADEAGAYALDMDEVRDRVGTAVKAGTDEVHIVGGLNPKLPLSYYRDLVATVKQVGPNVHVVGFTATEYDYMSRTSGVPLATLLKDFKDAGVDRLPGGGAEIFATETRQQIAPKKIDGKRWLAVMETAHSVGLHSNATILYNHVESLDDMVDHLKQLRELQDRTAGFKALVPLPYHGEKTTIPARHDRASGMDSLRLFAAARIYLDNLDHIKALWMYLGPKFTQVLLRLAADDAGATYLNETIVHAAGASTPASGSEQGLRYMIEEAELTPIRTHSGYR